MIYFVSNTELTPFEAELEAIAEFNAWFDLYQGVDRYMEPDDLTALQGVMDTVKNQSQI